MAVLHFLLIFVASRLSYFVSAGDLVYNSTARAPSSWMTKEDSSAFTMRYILLKEIGGGMGFACRLLWIAGYNRSHLVITAVIKNNVTNEWQWRAADIVWIANQEKGIGENGTLSLRPDGDLVLQDTDGAHVWSTNTSNRSVVGIKLTEIGNLVLYDRNNVTIWQSSDDSEDTLLDGQILMAGKKLVARNSTNDWRKGEDFILSVTSQGLFAFYKSQLYFKRLDHGTRYVKSTNGSLVLYKSSGQYSDVSSRPSGVLFMRLDPDGHFRAYRKEDGPVDLLSLTDCEYPTVCGNYKICSDGVCSCPQGYTQEYLGSGPSGACTEERPTRCDGPHANELVELKDVSYFGYVDSDAAVAKGIDVESCKQLCLANCSCKVALFRYVFNYSHGRCYIPSPVLSLIYDNEYTAVNGVNGAYNSWAYIKIPKGSSRSVSRTSTMRIALPSLGAFIVMVMAIGISIACLRKTRGLQEEGDDNFEEMVGMPLRFSYEELKIATTDFLKKLGEGGFGSVFEGQLSNGEKIAVKRLEGFGQGKKEFLAEVKTIGSIHHVNLARLIGFCAEKSNRLLVYEFMCKGSLDKWIFNKNPSEARLDWQSRRNIILDIAKGLAYLHEECRQRIVHLDIKPQNILLDLNLRAKVSDFGLSRLIDKDQSQIVTTLRGTPGYLAPEWLTSSITEKADVYSFGVVVMEIVCGRKNLDRSQPEESMHLLNVFKSKAKEDQLVDLVDNYAVNVEVLDAVKMLRLAAWCLQTDYNRRPSMSVAVKVIEGIVDIDANIDYSFPNPTLIVGTGNGLEMKSTVTLLPSILSAPR